MGTNGLTPFFAQDIQPDMYVCMNVSISPSFKMFLNTYKKNGSVIDYIIKYLAKRSIKQKIPLDRRW